MDSTDSASGSGGSVHSNPMAMSVEWLVALYGVGSLIGIVGAILFTIQRNKFPCNGRDLSLILAVEFFYVISGVVRMVKSFVPYNEIPCWFELLEQHRAVLFITIITARFWRLWFLYFMSNESLSLHRHRLYRTAAEQSLITESQVSDSSLVKPSKQALDTVTVSLPPLGPADGWFGRRAHWGKGAFLWRAFALVTLVDVVALNSLYFTFTAESSPDVIGVHCPQINRSNYWLVVRIAQIFVCIFVAYSKIRKVRDGFGMRTEWRYVAIFGALGGLCYILRTLFDDSELFDVLLWVCFRVCIAIMSWYPVWHSYNLSQHISCCRPRVKNSRVTPSPFAQASAFLCSPTQWIACLLANNPLSRSSVSIGSLRAKPSTTLKEILSDEDFENDRRDFENHVASEFAAENIVFWDDTTLFESVYDSRDDTEVACQGLEAIRKFLTDSSPLEINIPSAMKLAILTEFRSKVTNFDQCCEPSSSTEPIVTGRINNEVFTRARETIYKLMKQDTFVRWRQKRLDLERSLPSRNAFSSESSPATEARASCGYELKFASSDSDNRTSLSTAQRSYDSDQQVSNAAMRSV